jgi:UMF1 family MFS transporter
MEKGNKKIINGWALYDWANSVYSLVIISAIFPIYYNNITSSKNTDIVHFLGFSMKNTALYSFSLSFSYLLIAFASPMLSAIADYCGNKKSFMRFFSTLGAASCAALFFFDSADRLWLAITAFVLAGIGFSGSIVFYNAYLPEIAAPEEQDKVSAKGFAMGYIGSSILLIFNLTMILFPQWYGNISTSLASRISFLTVGIWWFSFAQITFARLPDGRAEKISRGILFKGYKELLKVWTQLKDTPNLKKFLMSFFFYNMGVQTVMYVAALFGDKELKMNSGELITTILIIQFVGVGGAYLFSYISRLNGNLRALSIAISTWILICICAYFVYSAKEFYALAFAVGTVMGGIQSLSRSTYSKLLPEAKDHASYFSFYDVCDKLGIVLGTMSYGIIEQLTGSMRNSIVALMLFFIIGLILLLRIKSDTRLKFSKSVPLKTI